jgi:cysteinyl-tRNA synthetase
MDDDFNTALGLAHLGEGFRKINELINTKSISPEEKTLLITKIKSDLKELTETLGIIQSPPKTTIEKYQIKGAKKKGVDPEWIQEQIRQRNKARLHKNWALADAIREKLLKAGIELRDLKNETIWRVIK